MGNKHLLAVVAGLMIYMMAASAKADPVLYCQTDGVGWPIRVSPTEQVGEFERAYITYENASQDWFSCTASCDFKNRAGVTALNLNCSGVVPPSLPDKKDVPGYNMFCLATVANPKVGMEGAGPYYANKHCTKVQSPM